MKTLGLYIHIPFCKSKCRYCDFCSFPHPTEESIDGYLDALIEEIRRAGASAVGKMAVDTVYFGGGTPTLLTLPRWERLVSAVRQSFCIVSGAEITAECNPATADLETLCALRSLGLNRLSIGAQSMNNSELKLLGRLHRAEDVLRTLSQAREAGFDNLSADVMFGIPSGTRESLEYTLKTLLALSPEHLSVYGLQIEEGTYFARHPEELALPDEETERAMYMDTVKLLADHGMKRYEISNFAKNGFESRHNLKYWHREDYLGLGLAAHSCIGDIRFSNTEELSAYLAGNTEQERQQISKNDILCERVMLGMRLDEGVDFEPLKLEFGAKAEEIEKSLAAYIHRGLVTKKNRRLAFTDDGMYVSNAILGGLLDFDA